MVRARIASKQASTSAGAVPAKEGAEPRGAETAGGHLAVEVAAQAVGQPGVSDEDPDHVPVRPARIVELDRRDHQAFLVGAGRVGGHRAGHRPADVVVVTERLDERDHPVVLMWVEDRHGHAEIREVADPALRLVDVVVEVDVAGPHRREREVPHDRLDESRVRAARELPTPPVVNAGPEVPRLPDHRRAGRPLDGRLDLRFDRGQRPLHDLEDDGVRAGLGTGGRRLAGHDAPGVPVHACQDHVAEGVDLDPLTGEHDRRRAELLHDRRAGQAIARPEARAIVHGALDRPAIEPDTARRGPGALGASVTRGLRPRRRPLGEPHTHDPEVDPLDTLTRSGRARVVVPVAVAVPLLVRGVKPRHDLGGADGVDRAGRHLDGDLPRLAEVPEVGQADQTASRLGHALARERRGRLRFEPRQLAVDEAEVEPRMALDRSLDVVVLEVDGEETERRDRAGRRGNQRRAEAQEVDEPAGLERARSRRRRRACSRGDRGRA